MKEPKIEISPHDIYVLQVSKEDLLKENPYDLQNDLDEYTHISATDYKGNVITLNLAHFTMDLSQVDYSKTGTYFVTISVMDDEGNMALDYLTIHVLNQDQVKSIQAPEEPQLEHHASQTNEPKKKRKKSNHKGLLNLSILPKTKEQMLQLSDDSPFADTREKEVEKNYDNTHFLDKGSNHLIGIILVIVLIGLIYLIWKLFF